MSLPEAGAGAAARPELEAHDRAARLALPVLVAELGEILGPRLVAYVAGVREAATLREWSAGDREARPPVPERLRFALQVALLIARHDGPAVARAWLIAQHDNVSVARAWFQGLNPQLDDRSAARLLHAGELDEVGPQILSAARAFVSGG